MGIAAPKPYRATVALIKPPDQSTDDDPFEYLDRRFTRATSARLWAAKQTKTHPRSSGSATVNYQTWEFDGVWILMNEECVWSM